METVEQRPALLADKDDWISQLEESLNRAESEVEQLRRKVSELEGALQNVERSRSYRAAIKVSRLCRRMAAAISSSLRALGPGERSRHSFSKLQDGIRLAGEMHRLLRGPRGSVQLLVRACCIEAARLAGLERNRIRSLRGQARGSTRDRVDVSIVIPLLNQKRSALGCLAAIVEHTSGPSYELIVVSDAPAGIAPMLMKSGEANSPTRTWRNRPFIDACNRGAVAARGEFLVFLDDDTVVTPGWLQALAETFQNRPGTGLACAKLVDRAGRLHAAASVLWRDGTRSNDGESDDGGRPSHNFMREVDDCPGTGLMVPRALFEKLGGFDSPRGPVSDEDADLALKIRHAGHKVIYQPHARIIHRGGSMSGPEPETAATSRVVVHPTAFRERRRHRLDFHPPAPQADADRNAETRAVDPASRDRVLVIDHRLPFFDHDAGSLRMLEMVRALAKNGQHVTFIPGDLTGWPRYLEAVQSAGVEVIHRPYYFSVLQYLREHGREFSLVILSRLATAARFMPAVRRLAPHARIVFDTVDLHFVREERQARIEQDSELESAVASRKQLELQLARRADLTLVVSPIEKAILEQECPGVDVRILSTIHALEQHDVPGFDGRRDIAFIGSFGHTPNADAVLYFAREIFPLVRLRLTDAAFQVIGPGAPPEVLNLASPSIRILGQVPDIRPLFDRARALVAPLRFGAGVKGKVSQSMALGVPTIVTSIAAEGMHLVHEDNAMIADDPESFADALVRVCTTRELWERVSANGRQTLREHFSVEAASRAIDELLLWAGRARAV